MNPVLQTIQKFGIVPVVQLDEPQQALPLAESLMHAGLGIAEITFRTTQAEQAIHAITKAFPKMLVGAGTVLTTAQVDAAVDAGAQFIVCPGFNPKVVGHCRNIDIPVIPGCSSPSDIERAIEMGLEVVKFFPSEPLGGLKTIRAISAPYPQMKFIPTGGIDQKNMGEYLANPHVLAVGGSFMVKSEWLTSGDYTLIEQTARDAVQSMLGFSLGHIGINHADAAQANDNAGSLLRYFGLSQRNCPKSTFVGELFELMHFQGMGDNGHVAIHTSNVERAVFYLSARGAQFDESTARYDGAGHLTFIYLKEQIGGFAIHLFQ